MTGLLGGLLLGATSGHAAEPEAPKGAPKEPPIPAALQEQINELREGQLRLLKEVQELKTLLTAKEEREGRTEVGAKPPPASNISLNVYRELFRGSPRARVAIVEYSDFDCSHCAKFALEIYPQLARDYIQPGRIRYYFRDLPAPGSPESLLKSRTARCAGEQGKFWEMHDLLFTAQSRLPAEQEPVVLAKSLGLDLEKFNVCLSNPRYVDALARVTADAARMGISGTPAFLIGTVSEDGNFFRAAHLQLGGENLDELKKSLDEVLAAMPGN